MNPDDVIISALGVLLTEVRVSRRALEEIDRASSRYMGIEFAKAFAEGANFGAPPMYQGALRVHVININDLAPGNSIADLLIGILGGLGSLVGGMIGSTISGIITTLGLPSMIADLRKAIADIKDIVRMLGIGNAPPPPDGQNPDSPVPAAKSNETSSMTLDGLSSLVRALTALFTAGAGGTAAANQAGRTEPEVLTPAGDRWLTIISGVNRLLEGLTRLVDGLISLIPILVGSIALLITSLPALRRELLLTFQFLFRNILVLRGVVLTTVFEMMATVARLTSAILGILATALEGIVGSILGLVTTLLDNAFAALGVLTTALTSIIKLLLQWLVNGVFNTLSSIGTLPVFRTIDHFVRILPGLIEPIFMITVGVTANASERLPDDLGSRLTKAFDAGFAATAPGTTGPLPGGAVTGTGPTTDTDKIIGDFPAFKDVIDGLHATLKSAAEATGADLQSQISKAFGSVIADVNKLAGSFDYAIVKEVKNSKQIADGHKGAIIANADALAKAIAAPLTSKSPATGLEDIANAYQSWLTSDGTMEAIFDRAGKYLTRPPGQGGPAASAVDLARGGFERPRASVEIDKVEIHLDPPIDPNPPPVSDAGSPSMTDAQVWSAWHRHALDLDQRGMSSDDPYDLIA